ncbi:MAG: hypothetical protein QXI39_03405 [Candidatus Bathyarchaeia archaeon]
MQRGKYIYMYSDDYPSHRCLGKAGLCSGMKPSTILSTYVRGDERLM